MFPQYSQVSISHKPDNFGYPKKIKLASLKFKLGAHGYTNIYIYNNNSLYIKVNNDKHQSPATWIAYNTIDTTITTTLP
jgi:hypothetical protein